ncbi:transporter [Bacteroidia bacterium]|nr:transporter [Bacteroidia bacterium]MDB9882544.1 transporter [Bacteroidia bacterium]
MIKNTLTLLLMVLCHFAFAQIETDRPDFTESPNVVPKGAMQIETGFILENDKLVYESRLGSLLEKLEYSYQNFTINTTLFRYGLTDNIELRFNTNFSCNQFKELKVLESGFVNPTAEFYGDSIEVGFQTSFIGFKTNLYKNDKMSIGFLGHLYIPELASGDFAKISGQKIAPEFLIPLIYDITDKFGIAIQYGLTWDGYTPNPTTSYTMALGYSITDKLSFYLEPYGFLTNNGDELHLINGGFTYLINDNFQLDLTGGFGLNEPAPDNFLNCGASFLLFN